MFYQMKKAKCFHELFFNGLFGRLVIRLKAAGGRREFLLHGFNFYGRVVVIDIYHPFKNSGKPDDVGNDKFPKKGIQV